MKILEDILMDKYLRTPISSGRVSAVDYQYDIIFVKVNKVWHSLAHCGFIPPVATPANEAGLAILEIRGKLHALADELADVEEGLM